jgi:3-hydroxyisobutyrate dehydrogenase-like beta-hydroxyacid dehydrogenase
VSGFATVALIGFGEVGQILARELAAGAAPTLSAYDILFGDPASRPSQAIAGHAIRRGTTAADAVKDADLIVSAVTAAQDLEAARSIPGGLKPGAVFLDLNSASPGQKIASAEVIDGAGGRYVEAAVMSPFPPKGMGSPMLLGGPHAEAVIADLAAVGFSNIRLFSDQVGRAAAAKLCRSVMIKGVEALLTESLLSARHYGVEATVLASLSDLLPIPDWDRLAGYMVSRSVEHGVRRAEEMLEAARTVAEAGIEPLMSRAIAERQGWAADFPQALSDPTLIPMLDAILAATDRS